MKRGASFVSKITTSATIFATTTSNVPVTLSARFPQMPVNLSPTWLISAFATAVLTARASISTPTALPAPSSRPATDKIPLPQPISSMVSPGFTYFSSSSMQRRVVSCVPVPNARPGSRCSTTRSPASYSSSHMGRTSKRLPTGMGLKYFFQLLIQSSSAQLAAVMVFSMPTASKRSLRKEMASAGFSSGLIYTWMMLLVRSFLRRSSSMRSICAISIASSSKCE